MTEERLQREIETLKDEFRTTRRDYPAITYLVICGKDTRLHKDQHRSKPLTKKQRTALIKKDEQAEADALVQVQTKYEPTKDRIITKWEPELSDLGPEYYERHYLLAPKRNKWDKNNTLANLNALSSDMINLIIDDPTMREILLPETYSSESQIGKWLAIARHLQGKYIPKLVFRLSDSNIRMAKDGEPYYSVVDDDVCLFSIKACDALIQRISEQHNGEKPAGTGQDEKGRQKMYFDDCQNSKELGELIKEILDCVLENNRLSPELHKKLFPPDIGTWSHQTSTPIYLITLVNKARQRILDFRSDNPKLPPMPKQTQDEHKQPHKTLQEIMEWCIDAQKPAEPEQKIEPGEALNKDDFGGGNAIRLNFTVWNKDDNYNLLLDIINDSTRDGISVKNRRKLNTLRERLKKASKDYKDENYKKFAKSLKYKDGRIYTEMPPGMIIPEIKSKKQKK